MPEKFGQNFLQDNSVLEKIIAFSNLKKSDFILEIGPGKGVLTEKLSAQAKKIIAIEIDDSLIPHLEKQFPPESNVKILHQDILKTNLPALFSAENYSAETPYKVIANIPYYITAPIIRLFLEQTIQPQELILMIQKEVAERITAPKGNLSLLAVSVAYYASSELLFFVDKNSFFPVPKVDSAVIRIRPQKKFQPEKDKQFFRLVKIGFSAKRKTLLNNLACGLHLEKSFLEKIFSTLSLNPNIRAQELDILAWEKLASQIYLSLNEHNFHQNKRV